MKTWFAVMKDFEDSDWGTGSYDCSEAAEKALSYRSSGFPDAYIAVIDESGNDPICVDEVHSF